MHPWTGHTKKIPAFLYLWEFDHGQAQRITLKQKLLFISDA